MATVGRKKRKRLPGSGSGVGVRAHTRSPRGPDTVGGKRKSTVRVDPYQRGKPTKRRKTSGVQRKKRKRKTKKR